MDLYNEFENKSMSAAVWKTGLIIAAFNIVSVIIQYFTGTILSNPINYAIMLISFAGIFLAQKYYRDKVNGGIISFKRALKFAILVCLVYLILSAVFFYFIVDASPEVVDEIRSEALNDMSSEDLQGERGDVAIKMMKMFTTPIALASVGLLVNLFLAFIAGLITSAMVKKEV